MWLLFVELLRAQSPVPAPPRPEMIPEEAMDIVGHAVPAIQLQLRDGGTFNLADHRGKVVVISFWASWCSPCRQELPALSQLAKERKDIVFVTINVDRAQADAEKFLANVQMDLPVAFDPESLSMGQFLVMSMPTMFVIDRKGNVHYRKIGYSQEKGFTELLAAVEKAP